MCFCPVFVICRSIWLPARQRVKLNKYTYARTHSHKTKILLHRERENLKYFYNFLTIDYMTQNVAACVRFIAQFFYRSFEILIYMFFSETVFSSHILSAPPHFYPFVCVSVWRVTRGISVSVSVCMHRWVVHTSIWCYLPFSFEHTIVVDRSAFIDWFSVARLLSLEMLSSGCKITTLSIPLHNRVRDVAGSARFQMHKRWAHRSERERVERER